MTENARNTLLILALAVVILLFFLLGHSDYLANASVLAIFIAAELMLAAVLKYGGCFLLFSSPHFSWRALIYRRKGYFCKADGSCSGLPLPPDFLSI